MLRLTLITVLVVFFCFSGRSAQANNRFAPLSVTELETAVSVLKTGGHLPEKASIVSINLWEPEKDAPESAPRVAKATIIDHNARQSSDVFIDLRAGKVHEVRPITNGQPIETNSEFQGIMDVVRQNPQWQAAIQRRGITNLAEVYIVTWAGGHQPRRGVKAHRYGRSVGYYAGTQKNQQGPPIEGVEAVVDLDDQKVLKVIDTGVRKVPVESTDFYDPYVRGTKPRPLKPLVISQPNGPSFEAKDFEVSWDRWKFAWSFNAREGLVLHQVRYVDEDRERSILHRASISEMLVPYGSPSENWFWRNAVDEGEYGLGISSFALVRGHTAPPHATLLDVPMCGEDGTVAVATNRVALYERVNESLWSHTTPEGETIGRRSRELVIFFIATVGNYDYRYSWVFRQDGVIEFDVGMTGILLMAGSDAEICGNCGTGEIKPGPQKLVGDERFGSLVAPNTIAVNHQHFVNMRLDFDIDGETNSVKELNTRLVRGRRANPYRNAWEAVATVFGKEREAMRDFSPGTDRHWAVFNPTMQTELGHFPAYLIEPAGTAIPLLAPNTPTRQLLGFVDHPFHATRYHAGQLYAGGEYPNQVTRADHVGTWSRDNESIHNQDVVVWYTLGMTHVPRPEEYPVMPTSHAGFRLVPKAFFNKNPALDVPEESKR